MDFRMYDNALGRFHNIDKMTDIMPSLSPYRFAFNNPVLWNDPTGLLEEDGASKKKKKDKTPTIQGREEFIIGRAKNKQPASFNYSLVSLSDWRSPNRPTLEQYNKHHGTNYQSVNDWYYHEKYMPAQNKMTTERNQAGRTVIGTLTVLATAGVGTAYALPVAAACSPAIQSTASALISNPTVQQAVLRMGIDAGTQYAAKGNIDIADVAITGIIPTNNLELQLVKPWIQASVDFNNKGQLSTVFNGSKNNSSFALDVFTGYWTLGAGYGASPKNTLGTEGVAGMTNFLGNQMNEMIKNEK
jgi:hypothetical protein